MGKSEDTRALLNVSPTAVGAPEPPTSTGDGRWEQSPTDVQAPARRLSTFYSLRFKDFRFLWFGSFFSSAGQWIQQATLSWLIYDITGSTVLLGAINGMRAIPMLFLSPLAGVAADRFNNKSLMQTTQVFLMVVTLLMALGLSFHMVHTWHLFLFTLLTGMAWAFNQPVRQSVVFQLVPRDAIPNAVALNSTAFNATRILGPSVAGLLISTLGPQGNFFVQSAMYVGVSITITMMAIPPMAKQARQESATKQLAEGFSYLVKKPVVRTLMIMALFPVVFAMPYQSLMPAFAKDVFHGGARSYGLLLSLVGVGGLLGGLFTASISSFERRGLIQIAAMIAFGAGLVAFSFVHHLWAAAGLLVVTGFSQMVYMTTNQTMMQMSVPDRLRGRITSLFMLNMGLMPLGTFLAGFAAEFLGPSVVVMIMGLTCVGLATVVALWVPQVRNMRLVGPGQVRRHGYVGD